MVTGSESEHSSSRNLLGADRCAGWWKKPYWTMRMVYGKHPPCKLSISLDSQNCCKTSGESSHLPAVSLPSPENVFVHSASMDASLVTEPHPLSRFLTFFFYSILGSHPRLMLPLVTMSPWELLLVSVSQTFPVSVFVFFF